MNSVRSTSQQSRLAWLEPLSEQQNSAGPWRLKEYHSQWRAEQDIQFRQVGINSLLNLVMGVLTHSSKGNSTLPDHTWVSNCGRFTVTWHKRQHDTTRLFVQDPDDFFGRVSLFIEDQLSVSFQEPVWPHLQRDTAHAVDRLVVPVECLRALTEGVADMETCVAA